MPVHVRTLDLPAAGAGRMALLTLDPGDPRKPFVLGAETLPALERAVDEAERLVADEGLVAIGVTGVNGVFCAGADLKSVARTTSREDAVATAELGHRVLGRFATSPVPTFAYVNGLALGGGLETALHCTYRTVSEQVRGLGLPEAHLGLVPGWGGTYLLPRIAGPDVAVQVAVENALANNRTLTGPQAFEAGIVDARFEAADFLVESLRWTASVLAGTTPVTRRDLADETTWTAEIERGRAVADARVHGAAPAPYRTLDLLAASRTADRETHFAAEEAALGDLIVSGELRAGLYAFDLVQRYAKKPAGAPARDLARKVTSVGVVGAGLMASQLALLLLHRLQVPVVLTDVSPDRVEKGVGFVREGVAELLRKGRVSPDTANRLSASVSGSVDKSALADADFVVEAVFEELAVKQDVLRELEPLLRPDAVIATNTSSLSVTAMASVLEHPQRFVGFHFFNPVAVLPLVEVVRTPETDEASLATAFAVGARLKKTCVLVQDAPAFVVNRISTRMFDEVVRALDAGTPLLEVERSLDPLGLPMSPFRLASFVGPAVMLHVHETLAAAFPDRYRVSGNLRRWVEAGGPALVTPKGPVAATGADEGLFEVGSSPLTREEVLHRVQDALADEVRRVLDEGVVAGPEDVDVCLVLGTGHPLFTGGITPYLDRVGASERVTGRRFHPAG
ncbi:3-hydroxyacyl-CoA dehydrogenase/enoyl-CoA hydratase/carnithine racemase [Kineococcus radiotolerans]|uniref:3-hydroxyacyl-CoA dehydrogenase/enoyl-CoA hydratase/carnithine racemase n=1 Tax=Kineococcus radiotolerans TaxID=131568 RepID=A0A7W4TNK2_KINRA|nr:3-hydroxyacyl-CoA dehydrogenase NAD-binding domain-containing protein [Kineococcus radiotolerans]MBB2901812.1 3-hydroxyacyl-CoA dehydrogenase/enoyl-CoA hydratase/carnithine racemase [Kineococcus radiotolerans]